MQPVIPEILKWVELRSDVQTEETANAHQAFHAEDYDYVLLGISDQKGASALDKMTELMASTLLEKRKI